MTARQILSILMLCSLGLTAGCGNKKAPAKTNATTTTVTSSAEPATSKPKPAEALPLPTGYISRDKAVVYADHALTSRKQAQIAKMETVFILETRMEDEKGNPTPTPSWYKIQAPDKSTGWVLASFVTVN